MVQNRTRNVRKLLIRSHANTITRTHVSPPHCITDHRAGSVHFNILFMRVYRCALLERWCAHQHVESHTSNLLRLVSVTAVHARA